MNLARVGGCSPFHVTFSGRNVIPHAAVSSRVNVGSATVARCHWPFRAEIHPASGDGASTAVITGPTPSMGGHPGNLRVVITPALPRRGRR
jgi:hypothetical protein